MNKKKIIATFLLSANLFGSAFFSNTSAFQISTSGYNNENVKVQTENDPELTFFALAKGLNQKYDSLPAQDKGFFKIETLDLSQVSNIDKNFFSFFNKFLSNSSCLGCADKFIKTYSEYSTTYHGLVALDNKYIEIILSDDMASKIINNPSEYGINSTTIIYQNISKKNIHAEHAKSEKNSHIDWKEYDLENILIEEYNARSDTQNDSQFAKEFIKNHQSALLCASTIKNYPNTGAILSKLCALRRRREVYLKYKNGTVNYDEKIKGMKIHAMETSRNSKKPKKNRRTKTS